MQLNKEAGLYRSTHCQHSHSVSLASPREGSSSARGLRHWSPGYGCALWNSTHSLRTLLTPKRTRVGMVSDFTTLLMQVDCIVLTVVQQIDAF